MALARLNGVTLDCPEPSELAEFSRRVTGGEIVHHGPDFVVLTCVPTILGFQRAPRASGPSWPEPSGSPRAHLDFAVADPAMLDDVEARAVALGARRPEAQPRPELWRVLLDPVGHPFCLTTVTG